MRKALLLPVLALSLAGCYTHVEPGYGGILVESCSGGGVNPTPLGIGYHSTGVCSDIEVWPTTQQTLFMSKDPHETSPVDDSFDISIQGANLRIDAAMTYSPEFSKLPSIYNRFKTDIKTVEHDFMRPNIKRIIQMQASGYNPEEVMSEKRDEVRVKSEAELKKFFEPIGFSNIQLVITDVKPDSKNLMDAINTKVTAGQNAAASAAKLQEKINNGKNDVADAQARALVRKTQADAEAYYNKTITSSLTPELVRMKWIEKWDGRLPITNAGSNMSMLIGESTERNK